MDHPAQGFTINNASKKFDFQVNSNRSKLMQIRILMNINKLSPSVDYNCW